MQPNHDAGVRFKQILKNTENIATSLTKLSSLLLQCHSRYRFRRNRNRNDSVTGMTIMTFSPLQR